MFFKNKEIKQPPPPQRKSDKEKEEIAFEIFSEFVNKFESNENQTIIHLSISIDESITYFNNRVLDLLNQKYEPNFTFNVLLGSFSTIFVTRVLPNSTTYKNFNLVVDSLIRDTKEQANKLFEKIEYKLNNYEFEIGIERSGDLTIKIEIPIKYNGQIFIYLKNKIEDEMGEFYTLADLSGDNEQTTVIIKRFYE